MDRRGFLKFLPLAIPGLGLAALEVKPKTVTTGDFNNPICPTCSAVMYLHSKDNKPYPVEPTAYANRWWQCLIPTCKTKHTRYRVMTNELEIIV